MKVVINKRYGGFGLSIEAKKKINEIGCEHSKWIDENEYFKSSRTRDDEEARSSHCKFCEILREKGKILIDEHRESLEARACPALIKIVEEMGEKANGKYAALEVIDIPDDIEWTIEEYDGIEWIAEKHRTWG